MLLGASWILTASSMNASLNRWIASRYTSSGASPFTTMSHLTEAFSFSIAEGGITLPLRPTMLISCALEPIFVCLLQVGGAEVEKDRRGI
jgi:hypothetical protein